MQLRRLSPTERIEIGMQLLGQWIRDARRRAGFTQWQLARMAGVHQSTISRLENARFANLALKRLAAIVAALQGALSALPLEPP